jgi:hypothetical protein
VRSKKPVGIAFLAIGIAFMSLGMLRQSSFIGVGVAFLVLGIVFLARSKAAGE